MAWTAPTIRATGYLVTASDWNTDLVDNLLYLKGSAGPVELDDSLSLAAGKSISADKIYAGPAMYACHKGTVREMTIGWEDDTGANYQVTFDTGNGGSVDMGGGGQIVLKVDLDDGVGSYAAIYNKDAVNSALVNPFNASRNPYLRVEFAHHQNSVYSSIFIGLRETPGGGMPAGEKFAGLYYAGAVLGGSWWGQNSDGAGNAQTQIDGGLTASVRHVVEIVVVGEEEVDIFVDGTLVHQGVTHLPTGDMQWCVTLFGSGDPSANDGRITIGKIIAQENLY